MKVYEKYYQTLVYSRNLTKVIICLKNLLQFTFNKITHCMS